MKLLRLLRLNRKAPSSLGDFIIEDDMLEETKLNEFKRRHVVLRSDELQVFKSKNGSFVSAIELSNVVFVGRNKQSFILSAAAFEIHYRLSSSSNTSIKCLTLICTETSECIAWIDAITKQVPELLEDSEDVRPSDTHSEMKSFLHRINSLTFESLVISDDSIQDSGVDSDAETK